MSLRLQNIYLALLVCVFIACYTSFLERILKLSIPSNHQYIFIKTFQPFLIRNFIFLFQMNGFPFSITFLGTVVYVCGTLLCLCLAYPTFSFRIGVCSQSDPLVQCIIHRYVVLFFSLLWNPHKWFHLFHDVTNTCAASHTPFIMQRIVFIKINCASLILSIVFTCFRLFWSRLNTLRARFFRLKIDD